MLCTTLNMTLETGDTDKEKPDIDMDYEEDREEKYKDAGGTEYSFDTTAGSNVWRKGLNHFKMGITKRQVQTGTEITVKVPDLIFNCTGFWTEKDNIHILSKQLRKLIDDDEYFVAGTCLCDTNHNNLDSYEALKNIPATVFVKDKGLEIVSSVNGFWPYRKKA